MHNIQRTRRSGRQATSQVTTTTSTTVTRAQHTHAGNNTGNIAGNTLNIRAFFGGRERRRRRRSNATCGHESDSDIVFSVISMSLSTFLDRSRFLYKTTCILIDALRECERGGRRRERQKNRILRCAFRTCTLCYVVLLFPFTIPLPCQKLRVEIIKGRGNTACGRGNNA